MKQDKSSNRMITQQIQILQQPVREHTSQSDTTTSENGKKYNTWDRCPDTTPESKTLRR